MKRNMIFFVIVLLIFSSCTNPHGEGTIPESGRGKQIVDTPPWDSSADNVTEENDSEEEDVTQPDEGSSVLIENGKTLPVFNTTYQLTNFTSDVLTGSAPTIEIVTPKGKYIWDNITVTSTADNKTLSFLDIIPEERDNMQVRLISVAMDEVFLFQTEKHVYFIFAGYGSTEYVATYVIQLDTDKFEFTDFSREIQYDLADCETVGENIYVYTHGQYKDYQSHTFVFDPLFSNILFDVENPVVAESPMYPRFVGYEDKIELFGRTNSQEDEYRIVATFPLVG